VSETRPRRGTIIASLTALATGAAIASGATILNAANGADSAIEVPLVVGYNDSGNRLLPTDGSALENQATALSGPGSATSPPAVSSSGSAGSSTSSPASSPPGSSGQPAPPAGNPPGNPPPPPQPQTPTTNNPPPPGSPSPAQAAEVVRLVNEVRQRHIPQCPQLQTDDRLTKAAQGHSTDMATRNYFSHTTPEGVTFDQRIRTAGYSRPAAENIAKGQRSAESVMDSWMKSSGHARNILNCDYRRIGVGVDTNGWYWVQNFGF
jgi:uncharacterized protein YkwD